MLRPIITIDEEKCNGCGQCITDCAEGALAIVGGKAKLISEIYCDGLGACLNCPQGALALKMQDAPAFDEKAAFKAKAEREAENSGWPKNNIKPLQPLKNSPGRENEFPDSALSTWPIQLQLVNPNSAWLVNSHILLAAQCSGFALQNIHQEMRDKILMIACPKLENQHQLIEKLSEIIKIADPASLTILRMSVPCCGGLERIVEEAKKIAEKSISVMVKTVIL